MNIALPDLAAMQRLGASIAEALRPGDVVALSGGLGAGKTTLARAIIAALGHGGEVPSPSFAIIETYDPPAVRLPLVHADFYRLDDPREVEELGLDDYRQGAALIAEWPEHAGGFGRESACLSIMLESAEMGRVAIVSPGPDWLGRLSWT
ncbi:tRNA (adenosine(37)-N6)-threonylcarbamoyltransferase complex ATPase subunit type 1 TsaE [Novosphingobium sp. TH158]|uniref:tRNA (adenosine(37)-N6)-threonylcarbamoyltransferase complex ATPase subunit type 1 TsaE n=1 Tax=Novosphingobium sp. TH158 TaxID=2067455 RepID=UPI000C7C2832|nr:tRNA (adenosine(37)-N6)-threonylcarbamoyltransferase complex ATPase subunit type 1 TsaE [Novosphingobium sp. TH158]PLK26274.1 tRNA (adenosine(37)-N6)-threonylcarbamoyltransferase complex ATPase subunit type 1 TsaE [Novosphingobium sp. TH158]